MRNVRIESLRLVAIVAIAVFHTFQPWFGAAVSGEWALGSPVLWALGCISLLGAFGNHVFFLISGYFLVPNAVRSAVNAQAGTGHGYWKPQMRKVAKRLSVIFLSTALWAACALAVDRLVVPVPRVGEGSASWLLGGIQFIWVYAALVLATPLVGWLWSRMRRPRVAVAAIAALVLGLSFYIAFISPGSPKRSLFEWRKLMSAAVYLVAYLTGAAIRMEAFAGGFSSSRIEERAVAGAKARLGREGLHARGVQAAHLGVGRLVGARWPLALVVAVSVIVEAHAAWTHDLVLLTALSYKSTSALSFAGAVAALLVAVGERPPMRASAARAPGRVERMVLEATPSILGFYLAQSMFSGLWHPVANEACLWAWEALGASCFLLVGIGVSLALLIIVLVADRLFRLPLLRLSGLR